MLLAEQVKFDAQKKKLQSLCDEHNLVFRFREDKYPITLTIQTTGDMGGQLSMLEEAEDDGYRSPEAKLIFSVNDGAVDNKIIGGTFTISEDLRTKIKNIFLKMHYFWLQFFHRTLIEKEVLSVNMMPVITDLQDNDDDDADEDPEDESDELAEAVATHDNDEDDIEGGEDTYGYDEPTGDNDAV